MKPIAILLATLTGWAAATLSVAAEDKAKVELIVTLSGPPAVLGGQVRDGFNLAVKTLGGKLGGLDAEVTVVDDELKPDVAVNKVKGTPRARSSQFRGGSGLLERASGDRKAGHRVEHIPHLAQRRHVEFCRQAV